MTAYSAAEDVVIEALVWAGRKGARVGVERFPQVYERRARLIVKALAEAGLLANDRSVRPITGGSGVETPAPAPDSTPSPTSEETKK